jgi:hypothetical protein
MRVVLLVVFLVRGGKAQVSEQRFDLFLQGSSLCLSGGLPSAKAGRPQVGEGPTIRRYGLSMNWPQHRNPGLWRGAHLATGDPRAIFMTAPLYRLIYHSRNRIQGSAEDIDRNLRDIMAGARRRNAMLGITGALMFNASAFVQILEGPRANVEQLYQRIRRDSRHDGVALLTFTEVKERAFGHWAMAFISAREADSGLLTFASETGFDPEHLSGESTLNFLHRMVLAQEETSTAA